MGSLFSVPEDEYRTALASLATDYEFSLRSPNIQVNPLNTPFDQIPEKSLQEIWIWTRYPKTRLDALAALAVWGCALQWQKQDQHEYHHPGSHQVIRPHYRNWNSQSGKEPKFSLRKVISTSSTAFKVQLSIIWAGTTFIFTVDVSRKPVCCGNCGAPITHKSN